MRSRSQANGDAVLTLDGKLAIESLLPRGTLSRARPVRRLCRRFDRSAAARPRRRIRRVSDRDDREHPAEDDDGADAPLPSGAFFATFPWFVIQASAPRSGDPIGYLMLDVEGGTCLAVFTDDDLAERFIRATEFGNGATRALENPDAFISLVNWLPDLCRYVAFDPPGRVGARARWVVPLSDVLRELRRK